MNMGQGEKKCKGRRTLKSDSGGAKDFTVGRSCCWLECCRELGHAVERERRGEKVGFQYWDQC